MIGRATACARRSVVLKDNDCRAHPSGWDQRILAVWVVVFFRDPLRAGPRGERYVLAAAEGHVVHVIETEEPMYVKERAVRISIFLSVFDVHVNRYPVDGTVELVNYNRGKFLHAADEKASLDNEQSSIGLRGPRGRVLVRQIAGLIARRIVTDAKPGARVTQGDRLGLIRFGSRTDVFLPVSAHPVVKVKPGDRVRVGGTVLAEYA
ncbi:MAG: phosphatidylserine decarboxylase family protein [Gemmatimonadetes bacterium]|nr:MAG: phosphatidylserine decarboxylase family protein [Gemmatimonadota bacterium]